MPGHFSHLYVEKRAHLYAETATILDRFSSAIVVEIDDYKQVFNRPRQSFTLQKRAMNLIVAVKKDQFLYDGPTFSSNFGHPHFYYSTPLLNCLYDCDYCYLQGMFPSANLVVFINQPDFMEAVDLKLRHHPVYLSISYDTDLLALEKVFGLCRRWIDFASARKELTVEIRTKSANFDAVADLQPVDGVILAWTLSPQAIAERWERGTPPVRQRMHAALCAVEKGWKVRLCLDPMIWTDEGTRPYDELLAHVDNEIGLRRIWDFSLGTFRMNRAYLRAIRTFRKDAPILYYPFQNNGTSISYSDAHRCTLTDGIRRALMASGVEPRRIIVFE